MKIKFVKKTRAKGVVLWSWWAADGELRTWQMWMGWIRKLVEGEK